MTDDKGQINSLVKTLLSEIKFLEGGEEIIHSEEKLNLPEQVRRFEIMLITSALFRTGGNQRRAARLLKLKPSTLFNKIKNYKINYPKFPEDY